MAFTQEQIQSEIARRKLNTTIDKAYFTPEQIRAEIDRRGLNRNALQETGRALLRTGRSAAAGLAGIGDVINMPIDAALEVAGSDFRFGRPSQDLVKGNIDKLTAGTAYSTAPENAIENISDTVSEFVSGSAIGAGAGQYGKVGTALQSLVPQNVKQLVSTGLAGAGLGVGEEVAPNNPEVALGLSLLGGGAIPVTESLVKSAASGANRMRNALFFGDVSSTQTPFAKEGRNLSRATGVGLTAGQQTGSKSLLGTEDFLGKSAATSDRMFNEGLQRSGKINNYFNKVIEKAKGAVKEPIALGSVINNTFDKTAKDLFKLRADQAKVDFNLVDATSQGAPIFTGDKFFNTLDELIAIGAENGSLPTDKRAAIIAKQIMKDFTKTTTQEIPDFMGIVKTPQTVTERVPMTATQFQKQLQRFGKYARGFETISEKLDKASSTAFARRLFGALNEDLDNTAASLDQGGVAAKALDVARQNYKTHSQALSTLDDTVLSNILGKESAKQPENIMRDVMKLQPSGLKQTLDVLSKANPELIPDIQKSVIQDAINNAFAAPGANLHRVSPENRFDPKILLSKLPDDKKLDVLFSYGGELTKKRVVRGIQATERILQSGGMGQSPTQPFLEKQGILRDVVGLRVKPLLERIIVGKQANKITDIILDPKQLDTLESLAGMNKKAITSEALSALTKALSPETQAAQTLTLGTNIIQDKQGAQ